MRFPCAVSDSDLEIKITDFTAGDDIIIHFNTFSDETYQIFGSNFDAKFRRKIIVTPYI